MSCGPVDDGDGGDEGEGEGRGDGNGALFGGWVVEDKFVVRDELVWVWCLMKDAWWALGGFDEFGNWEIDRVGSWVDGL